MNRKHRDYFYEILEDIEYRDVDYDKILMRGLYQFPDASERELENALDEAGSKYFYEDNKNIFARRLAMNRKAAQNFIVGDHITQDYPDSDYPDQNMSYAVVVGAQKGGGYKVVTIEPWSGRPSIKSTKNWNPSPVLIRESEIPSKLKRKLDKKAAPLLSGPHKSIHDTHPGTQRASRKTAGMFNVETTEKSTGDVVTEVDSDKFMKITRALPGAGRNDFLDDRIQLYNRKYPRNEARKVKAAEGDKCGKKGCIRQVEGEWRVMSGKTGDYWPAKYKSKKDAQDGLKAYHAGKFSSQGEIMNKKIAAELTDIAKMVGTNRQAADFWTQSEKIVKALVKAEVAVARLERLNKTIKVESVPESIFLGAIRRLRSGLDEYSDMHTEYVNEKGKAGTKRWSSERQAGRWEHRWDKVKKILRKFEDEDFITDDVASDVGRQIGKFLLGKVDSIEDEYEASTLQDIGESLQGASDSEDVDYALEELYDWADSNRVWLGL